MPLKNKAERVQQNALYKFIAGQYGGWCQRIPDTPYGGASNRKPFDGIWTCLGIAIENKKMLGGKTFNLRRWYKDRPNQYIGLMQFHRSNAGPALLVIHWKPVKGAKYVLKWISVEQIDMKRRYLELSEMQGEATFNLLINSIVGIVKRGKICPTPK